MLCVGLPAAGQRLEVWWPVDKQWYPGRVLSYTEAQGAMLVDYDDGDVEMLHMIMERYRKLPGWLCCFCTQLLVVCLQVPVNCKLALPLIPYLSRPYLLSQFCPLSAPFLPVCPLFALFLPVLPSFRPLSQQHTHADSPGFATVNSTT